MRFAHLSDFHYTTKGYQYPQLRPGLINALTRIAIDLATIEQHLDFVSITGDLTEAGDAESYIALKKLFDNLSIPVLVIPGNHDTREPFRDVFASEFHAGNRATLDYYTAFDRVQVIGLDTLDEGEVGGRLTRQQLSWIENLLLASEYSHTVISMHHPPFPIGQKEFDAIAMLDGREQFAQLLRKSRSDVIVLSGHIHRPYQATWNGASCYIAGGPSLQMGSHFCFGDDPLEVVDEPYTYFIHDIDGAAGHRVGLRYVKFEQPPAMQ